MRRDEFTVVVPTRNERHNVAGLLSSLPADVELVVVDASTDGTAEEVERLRPRHTTVLRDPGNIAVARQVGAEAAATPWLLFTDADVRFAADYFERVAELAPGSGVGCLVGTKGATDRFAAYYRWFRRGQRLAAALGIPAATGSNLWISREALRRCGGFDPQLTCNEDSEIAWRVQRAGFRVRFHPELLALETDSRRLDRGVVKKTAHSLLRCTLLYTGLLPRRWRGSDLGYWDRPS